MRRRKPCTLARRRLFGWKVRLLTSELQDSCGRAPPDCRTVTRDDRDGRRCGAQSPAEYGPRPTSVKARRGAPTGPGPRPLPASTRVPRTGVRRTGGRYRSVRSGGRRSATTAVLERCRSSPGARDRRGGGGRTSSGKPPLERWRSPLLRSGSTYRRPHPTRGAATVISCTPTVLHSCGQGCGRDPSDGSGTTGEGSSGDRRRGLPQRLGARRGAAGRRCHSAPAGVRAADPAPGPARRHRPARRAERPHQGRHRAEGPRTADPGAVRGLRLGHPPRGHGRPLHRPGADARAHR